MANLRKKIENTLERIIDPHSGKGMLGSGLVQGIQEQQGWVRVLFRPSSKICPTCITLAFNVKRALKQTRGVVGADVVVDGFVYDQQLNELLHQF